MSNMYSRLWTSIGGGLIFFGLYALLPSLFICLLFSLSCYMVLVEWPRVRGGYDITSMYPIAALGLLLAHVVQWHRVAPWYGLYPFLAAWLVDAVAYFVGSWYGRHLCWPQISPRKTWEGVAGGIAALVLCHVGLWFFGATTASWWCMLLSGVVVATTAMLGDLVMSWYKRQQGIKDTGGMLPGHGGLLDRFDSVLTVILVVKLAEFLIS